MKFPNDGCGHRKETKIYILKRLLSFPIFIVCCFLLTSCAVHKQIAGPSTQLDILKDSSLVAAQVGIAVYDATLGSYLYQYQDKKYFLPASNTKLFSLYEGLKWLGDSLPAIQYAETDSAVFLLPTGDPSLLHPDFSRQPLIDFLKKTTKPIYVLSGNWRDKPWGSGWSWDDYNDDYMVERSPLPVYGNVIRWVQENQQHETQEQGFPSSPAIYSIPEVDWKLRFNPDTSSKHFFVKRKMDENVFEVTQGIENKASQDIPFITHELNSAIELLKDTIGHPLNILDTAKSSKIVKSLSTRGVQWKRLHSQPVDSLYIPLMSRSDNFFAEQIIMMISQSKLGIMNDELIIDSLLRTDLKDLPQHPNWVDGSGLSRYNLFTPQDFVWVLNQLQKEFGMDRMKRLLTTGGTGTLRNYYKQDSGHIYAKTGSLSDVIALSGFIITRKDHLLLFSVLVNNHLSKPYAIRRAVESFLHPLIENN